MAPDFPPDWEPWLTQGETWVYDRPKTLDADGNPVKATRKLLQHCTTCVQDGYPDSDARILPIYRFLKPRDDKYKNINVRIEDFDVEQFKKLFLQDPLMSTLSVQAWVENPATTTESGHDWFPETKLPDSWELLPKPEWPTFEKRWLNVFQEGIDHGITDHRFRFRLVPYAQLTNWTVDPLPAPATPGPESDTEPGPEPVPVKLIDCAIRLLHWGFAPTARERVRMREVANWDFLGRWGSDGVPTLGQDLQLAQLDFDKWSTEVLTRVESATQKVEKLEYLNPLALGGNGSRTWIPLALNDEQGWREAMKKLFEWCKYPGRQWFVFRLKTADVETEGAQDLSTSDNSQIVEDPSDRKGETTTGTSGGGGTSGGTGTGTSRSGIISGGNSTAGNPKGRSSTSGGSNIGAGRAVAAGSSTIIRQKFSDGDPGPSGSSSSIGGAKVGRGGGPTLVKAQKNIQAFNDEDDDPMTDLQIPDISRPPRNITAPASTPDTYRPPDPPGLGEKRRADETLSTAGTMNKRQKTESSSVLPTEMPEEEYPDEEDIFEKFMKTGNTRACEQLMDDEEVWGRFCAFFKHPITDKSPEAKIKFPGINPDRPIHIYQAFAMFWMLMGELSITNGGFLGDEQGLGKTSTALGLIFLQRYIYMVQRDLSRAQTSASSSIKAGHLNPSFEPSQDCPQEPYKIKCPCAKGLLYASTPHAGPTLIIAPRQLLQTWVDEFRKLCDPKNPTKMILVVAHGSKLGSKKSSDELRKLLEDAYGGDKGGTHGPFNPNECGELGSNLIVLTTSGSYATHVKVGKGQIQWRRIIRDEMHMEKANTTNNIKIITAQSEGRHYGRSSVWGLSGTPFERSPQDLGSYITILRTKKWDSDPELSYGTSKWFAWIVNAYEDHMKALRKSQSPDNREILEALGNFGILLSKLMIRRTMSSSWHGKPLMDIPPSIPQDIKVHLHQADTGTFDWLRECAEHNLKKSASKRVLKKSGKGKAAQMDANPAASHIEYFNSSRRIRLAASVPAIAALLKAGQIKDSMFLANEILNQGWYDPNTQNSPYEQHLAAFSKNNPKFRAIERHILPFLGTDVWPIKDEDRAEFPKPVRPKIIFMSSYPAIALITQLWLKKKGYKVLLVHAALKDRAQLVNDFQEVIRTDADTPKVPKRAKAIAAAAASKEARDAEILVSTIALIGTGLTITRAHHVVLLEPAFMLRDESQAYARIRRFSQKYQTYTWRLINVDSVVDGDVVTRHDARQRLLNMTFTFQKNTDPASFGDAAPQDFDLVDDDKSASSSNTMVAPLYTQSGYVDSEDDMEYDPDEV